MHQASREKKSKSSGTVIFFGPPPGFEPGYLLSTWALSYDHTTVKAPHPIRTAKLSTVGPDQYYGRGLRGNLGCCMASLHFFIFHPCTFFFFVRRVFYFAKSKIYWIPVAPGPGRVDVTKLRQRPWQVLGIFMKQRGEIKNCFLIHYQ